VFVCLGDAGHCPSYFLFSSGVSLLCGCFCRVPGWIFLFLCCRSCILISSFVLLCLLGLKCWCLSFLLLVCYPTWFLFGVFVLFIYLGLDLFIALIFI
jgi:hypothetical protein